MDYKVEDYLDQLKQVCDSCKKSHRCKNHDNLCLLKRQVFTFAKWTLKRREKVGVKK